MNENQPPLKYHFRQALSLVQTHTIVIWLMVALSAARAATGIIENTALAGPLTAIIFIISIAATPIFYGFYYELIEDNYSSFVQIARNYVMPYLWLLLRMYLPAIFLAGLPMIIAPDQAGGGFFHITLISFSLIYLYVIPFYYFTGKQRGAISHGIAFLFNRLSISTPLILTVFLMETSMLLVQYSKTLLIEHHFSLFILLDFSTFLIASIVDFILFIMLIFIVKNEMGT